MTCTVLLKKIILTRLRTNVKKGDTTFLPELSSRNKERKHHYYYYYRYCLYNTIIKKFFSSKPQRPSARSQTQPAFSRRLSPDSWLPPFPLSPRLCPANHDRRESKKGAGGSKRPYEATFWIAMKGGRRFASTAAKYLGKIVIYTLAYCGTKLITAVKVSCCRPQTNGLYYKLITILIDAARSDAPIWSVTLTIVIDDAS